MSVAAVGDVDELENKVRGNKKEKNKVVNCLPANHSTGTLHPLVTMPSKHETLGQCCFN